MEASQMQPGIEVDYQPAWITWVAAVTTCLKALDVDCDTVDVAGYSGYAFCMSIHKELCPSGPTVLDWNMLEAGPLALGRTTSHFMSFSKYPVNKEDPVYQRNCREMYRFVERETAAGRPCVIWGTYVPEFGVAVGARDDHYHVKCFKEVLGEESPPIPYDGLDLVHINFALAFPSETYLDQTWTDRSAVFRAARLLTQRGDEADYSWGIHGYDTWILALKDNRAHDFGNAYNAQCWAEAKRFASEFLQRVASRTEHARAQLNLAVEHFSQCARAMQGVAELCPFPPAKEPLDEAVRAEAAGLLASAAAAEEQAIRILLEVCSAPWPVRKLEE